MKTKTLAVIGLTLGMLGVAHAEEGKKGGPKGKLPPEIIAKFDTDGDGKLDETERAAAKEARQAMKDKMLAAFDTDKDGKMSESEREAMKAAILEKYDADKDGKLSESEREAARAEFPIPPKGKGKGGKGGKKGPRKGADE